MAQNLDLRCVFGPSTLGAGAKTRLESRIKKFTPHCVCRYALVLILIRYLQTANKVPNLQSKPASEQASASMDSEEDGNIEQSKKRHKRAGHSAEANAVTTVDGWDVSFISVAAGQHGAGARVAPAAIDAELSQLLIGYFSFIAGYQSIAK